MYSLTFHDRAMFP